MLNTAICLLERSAARWPERVAIDDGLGETLTYAALRERSRRAAAGILRLAENKNPVMVYLPKSIGMVTGMFAALYSGRAYVPTDAAAPAARLRRILNNLAPSLIVTSEALKKNVEGADCPAVTVEELCSGAADESAVDAALSAVIDADPVYIMYTTGSTGEPKGVTIPHRGVLNFADWAAETFGWDEHTVIANQAPLYFDVSVMDVYGALRCGGRLILTPEALFRFPSRLPEFLVENGVTAIYWVPTVMIRVANAGALEGMGEKLSALKSVCFAGEVMPNKQLNVWRAAVPGAVYANLYGPTETDVCTAYLCDRAFDDAEALPIGRALPNLRVALVDEDGNVGGEGEICVAGSGITLGYRGDPERTEKAFLTLPDGRYYRTGDLGRYNEYGEILFLGRRDGQIKLRGNRIELGEVENAARMVDGVRNVCALFDRDAEQIVLFAEADRDVPLREFRRAMAKYVPAYMLPERAEVLRALPYNANKKIDRVALQKRMETQV